MQITIELPKEDVAWLDLKAVADAKSRDEMLIEALSEYRSRLFQKAADAAFGVWKDRTDIGDSVEYVRRLRSEWGSDADVPTQTGPSAHREAAE